MIFAKITQISAFFVSPNFRKVGDFAAFIECQKTKIASASGSFTPWRRLGLCPQTPFIGLLYRACHGGMPPDIAG